MSKQLSKLNKLKNLNTVQKIMLSVYLILALVFAYTTTDIDTYGYHELMQMIVTVPLFLFVFGIPTLLVVWLWGGKKLSK